MPHPHRCREVPCADRRLIQDAADGDSVACEQLIEAFWPQIASTARPYQALAALDRDELMQEGVVGLLTALRHYEPERGVPFWGYARWWVRQSMQSLAAQLTRPVVLSDRATRCLARVSRARQQHLQATGREATTGQLAHLTGLTTDHVERLTTIERTPRALEEPAGDETQATTLGERITDPQAEEPYDRVVEQPDLRNVAGLPDRLAPRERQILRARYGLGQPAQTLREIGDTLGVSAERVRQIEDHALESLRHDLTDTRNSSYDECPQEML